jgi:limonene-1,2-epoxide hydrolase
MSTRNPRQTLLAFHHAFTGRDVEALASLYAEDAINYQTPEEPLVGRAAIRASFEEFFAAFPNETTEIVALHEVGEWAIWEWIGGTRGVVPIKEFRGCGFFQVRDGLIVLQRGYWDKLTFLRNHSLPEEE